MLNNNYKSLQEQQEQPNQEHLVATITDPTVRDRRRAVTTAATFVLENVPSYDQQKSSAKNEKMRFTTPPIPEKSPEVIHSILDPPPIPPRKRSPGGAMFYLRRTMSTDKMSQRAHTFSQKTIIKPENCGPCGGR